MRIKSWLKNLFPLFFANLRPSFIRCLSGRYSRLSLPRVSTEDEICISHPFLMGIFYRLQPVYIDRHRSFYLTDY